MPPASLTEDIYSDTMEKMKATPCPRLIKLAPLHRYSFPLSWKLTESQTCCAETAEVAELRFLLIRLRQSRSGWLHLMHLRVARENCRTFCMLSDLGFSSDSILSCKILLHSLLRSCQHPLFLLQGSLISSSLILDAEEGTNFQLHKHTFTCCP